MAICWCLFLDRESSLFYQQLKARDVENSKMTGRRMIAAMSVSSAKFNKSLLRLEDTSVTYGPFAIEIFLSLLRRLF